MNLYLLSTLLAVQYESTATKTKMITKVFILFHIRFTGLYHNIL